MSDNTMAAEIRGLIESLSSYIETYHGGGVEFVDVKDNVVYVRLSGACTGCPLSPMTVKGWVEGTVKQFFPGIQGVETVE
ncbi:MAG TPA: NifU family protein [Bellilinea sp.]|nr:NifU family protein [Bellilinea sp.]